MGFGQTLFKAISSFGSPVNRQDVGDVYISPSAETQGILKAYMPKYMYRPPFGYPREDNVPLMRQLAQNPYIFSIHKTVKDEVSLAEWEIVYKEGSEMKGKMDDVIKEITHFIKNPNRNKESFVDLRKKTVDDILEVDAGVWVKVFNRNMQMVEIFARDGGSFLVNPDIYGYLGNREEYILPANFSYQWGAQIDDRGLLTQYRYEYGEKAAYFQYGTAVSASIPVPFGRREIVYFMQNPRTDSPYGRSPVRLLADIITTLVYGSNYNLDFFMNNNMPEGILQVLGANETEIRAFKQRLEKQYRVQDNNTGFMRKVAFKIPITSREAKFVPFQLDPKTMQILEQQQWFYKLALACYGVPPDEVGLTENSNKSTGANQYRVYLRKSAKPILIQMKYKMDMEILSEWGEDVVENLEFKWKDYDLDEDIKQHSLYKMQMDMGILTPEMVAEKEGIDYTKVQEYKEKQRLDSLELARAQGMNINQNFGQSNKVDVPKEDQNKKPEVDQGIKDILNKMKEKGTDTKSIKAEDDFERTLAETIKEKSQKIKDALEGLDTERNSAD